MASHAVPVARAAGLLLLLVGCADVQREPRPGTLPDYARPRVERVRAEDYQAGDVIRYRSVTRNDFRAEAPPAHAAGTADRMGAFTCANIVPDGSPQVSFSPGPEPGSMVARLDSVRFYAVMDRDCSWWNPKAVRDPDYILQHEQIHFGLTELQARRLSAAMRDVRLVVRSPEQAAEQMQRLYDQNAQESSEQLVRDSTRYDEETSFRSAPKAQARWLEYVERELAKTAP